MTEVGKVRTWWFYIRCGDIKYYIERPPVSLSQVVTTDALRQAVSEPSVAEQVQSLLPQTGEDPAAIVSSPQFQQVKNINWHSLIVHVTIYYSFM